MAQRDTPSTFPKRDHDHSGCLAAALKSARAKCEAEGIKWTALRETIFLAIAQSHKPVSAYDLIDQIATKGKRLAPVSIYRILDVLQKGQLIHKLESRNAYFVCLLEHGQVCQPLIFVCERCGRVAETEAPEAIAAIKKSTEAERFTMTNAVLELSGVCDECAGD